MCVCSRYADMSHTQNAAQAAAESFCESSRRPRRQWLNQRYFVFFVGEGWWECGWFLI